MSKETVCMPSRMVGMVDFLENEILSMAKRLILYLFERPQTEQESP